MAAIWYYLKKGERQGPVTAADLKKLAGEGTLSPEDMVWKEGMAAWEPARSVKGLFQDYKEPDEVRALAVLPPTPAFDGPTEVESLAERPIARRATNWFAVATMVIALGALILSLLALLRGGRPGGGRNHPLNAYDLSSPEAALRSVWRMRAEEDAAGQAAYHLLGQSNAKEALESLKVVDTVEVKKVKLLLFSYQRGDKERKDVTAFIKHPTRDIWIEQTIDELDLETTHPEAARRLREWRSRDTDALAD